MPVVHCKNEAEWKAERAKSIGASEVATILGLNPFETPLQLYFRKLGLAPEIQESEAMEWGHRLERAVAQRWADGRDIVDWWMEGHSIYRHGSTPFMHATPDMGWLTASIRGITQIKTVGVHMAHHWRDEDGCLLLPDYVYAQVQSEIYSCAFNCGASRGAVACLIGGQRYLEFDVPRDDEKIKEIIEACREFDRRLKDEDPPPPTENDLDTVKARFPESVDEKTVPLDWEYTVTTELFDSAKDKMSFYVDQAAEAEARIKLAMGDADKGVLPDGSGFTWRTNKRGSRVFRRIKADGKSDST